METKVSEKWFEENGWTRTDVPFKHLVDGTGHTTVAKHTIFVLNKGKVGESSYKIVRWEHCYKVTRDKRGKICNTSNWYSLSACSKDFNISSKIVYRKYTVEQIQAILKVIGMN